MAGPQAGAHVGLQVPHQELVTDVGALLPRCGGGQGHREEVQGDALQGWERYRCRACPGLFGSFGGDVHLHHSGHQAQASAAGHGVHSGTVEMARTHLMISAMKHS